MYVFKGLSAEIYKEKGSGLSHTEDFELEERSEIMRRFAEQIKSHEEIYRSVEAKFVYYHGIEEIRLQSKDTVVGNPEKPVFSGVIRYVQPYSGFDITGDASARIAATFDIEPTIGADQEIDGLAELIKKSGFRGSIEKTTTERDVF